MLSPTEGGARRLGLRAVLLRMNMHSSARPPTPHPSLARARSDPRRSPPRRSVAPAWGWEGVEALFTQSRDCFAEVASFAIRLSVRHPIGFRIPPVLRGAARPGSRYRVTSLEAGGKTPNHVERAHSFPIGKFDLGAQFWCWDRVLSSLDVRFTPSNRRDNL